MADAHFVLSTLDDTTSINLPTPDPGVDRTATLIATTQTTLGGKQIQQVFGRKRTYTLSWAGLTDAEFDPIDAFHQGDHGEGPFHFTWPGKSAVVVNITALSDVSPRADSADGTSMLHTASLTLQEV